MGQSSIVKWRVGKHNATMFTEIAATKIETKHVYMKGLSKYHLVKDTRLFRDGTSNTGNYQQLEECLEKPFQA